METNKAARNQVNSETKREMSDQDENEVKKCPQLRESFVSIKR